MADFIHVPATVIGGNGLPDLDAVLLQSINLDEIETITSWVSDTRPTPAGEEPYLPYVLIVFASGRELALPLGPHETLGSATAAVNMFCDALTSE